MAIFEDRFIKGSRFTQHFTLDDPSDQVVPKAGTDTVPGALALNLGNNLPADTTNATDALTAAGFNAMANQVDSTDPFCGNAVQQAVTVAVGQSIACDAAAQEAIACAIASNPDAVACLQAVLCGSTTSGKYYVATSGQTDFDGTATDLKGRCFLVDNGVVTNLTPTGLPNTSNFLVEVSKDKPVAYYRELGPIAFSSINQIAMSDTGVTQTSFSFAPGEVTNLFYDTVTKNLYANGSTDGGTRRPLKITLNVNGLATSVEAIAGLEGEVLRYAANGKLLLGPNSIVGAPTKSFDLVTQTVSTFTTGVGSGYGGVFDISPDGTKFVHSSAVDGYGGIAKIRDTTTGALIADLDFGRPISFNGGFFTEDGSHVVLAGLRSLPGGVGTPSTGNGHMTFSATTGALVQNKLYMVPTYSASGAEPFNTMQSTASNNAILTQNIEFGAIGEVRILENKNDAWTEVARLPGTHNRAGFYLVSA